MSDLADGQYDCLARLSFQEWPGGDSPLHAAAGDAARRGDA